MKKKIAIIGAGPGGLTAAMILSKRGYDVDVYEKEKSNGGMEKIKLKKSTPSKEKYFHLLLHRLPDKKGQLDLPLDEEGLITTVNEVMKI